MKKILLIDDERVFRILMHHELSGQGWQVLEAEDGEVGLKLALQEKPDVVVVDLRMPKVNGYQVCNALRSQQNLGVKTKIIVTTSSGYDSDRINALQSGADEYLVKPVKPGHLLKILDGFGLDKGRSDGGETSFATKDRETLVRFWGVRGSIPTPGKSTVEFGGNTSCVEVRSDNQLIVLDSGTGIRSLGLSLAEEFGDKPITLTLLITHTHWDHIQGFPFFPVAYNPKNTIRVLAFEGMRKSLEATLSSQMESPYFPVSMQQMPGNISIVELKDKAFQIGDVKVEAMFTNHPGICAAFRLTTSGGVIVYCPDNELLQRMRLAKAETDEARREAEEFARERDQRLVDFCREADVLIMDCQYDAEEYPRYVGWGHSCVDDSVALAAEAGVKRFFLFHHDPSHTDEKILAMEASAKALAKKSAPTMEVSAAREGLEVSLKAKT